MIMLRTSQKGYLNKLRRCILITTLTLVSCDLYSPVWSAGINEDTRFGRFREFFLEQYLSVKPVDALAAGYFIADSIAYIPDSVFFSRQAHTLSAIRDSMSGFDAARLSQAYRIDYRMILDRIESDLWYLAVFREQEWNPAWYNIGYEYALILGDRKRPLDARLQSVASRLKGATRYYEAAIANIRIPVREHAELAILQNEGSLEIFERQIPDSIALSGLSESERKILKERLQLTAEAIRGYLVYLRAWLPKLTEENSRSFRIGRELYETKFRHDIRSKYTAGEVYSKAGERKKELLEKMAEIARSLWSEYMNDAPMPDDDRAVTRKIIEQVSLKHTHRDSFMHAIEKQIPELEAFVRNRDLLWLDPSKPLVVRRTPGYMEGSGAGVSISAPGPFDPDGNTYYNVSPLDGYPAEMAESYLREYNNYTLQILNIHEAIPGHYAQLVYANNAPSRIRSLFGNGATIEGWAVYAERMMLEQGYGNNEPEMWLMYYKWHLRSVCNTMLDYGVHVLSWPEKVAIKFLTEDAFQETAEASAKWKRVKLSQVQLTSYFTGYTEIYELREEMKSLRGPAFSLKEFHTSFLNCGSAPVMYIRDFLTADF